MYKLTRCKSRSCILAPSSTRTNLALCRLHGHSRESTPSDVANNLDPESVWYNFHFGLATSDWPLYQASIRAPYLGEDSRVTLLRSKLALIAPIYTPLTSVDLDDKFQNWASPLFVGNSVGGQLDNPITISIEMARVYQLITRGSIREFAYHMLIAIPNLLSSFSEVIEQLQSEKGQLEYDSWKLQVENQGLKQNNWQLPIEWHEMKGE